MFLRIQIITALFLTAMILFSGCSGCAQKSALKGIEPQDDHNEQSKFGPATSNSRKPVKLKPFTEPSFAAVIMQFKADVSAGRGDPKVLAQKKKAIANPDLLWDFNFVVPNVLPNVGQDPTVNPFSPDEVMIRSSSKRGEPLRFETGDSAGIKHEFLGEVFYLTKDQEKRMFALKDRISEIGEDEWQRQLHEIAVEGLNPFTVAKYFQYSGDHIEESMAIEYSELAIQKYPNSAEVMLVWANCQPSERKIEAYNELVTKFPNFAKGHEILGWHYTYGVPKNLELAIQHYNKAMQLDSRIKEDELGKCYYWLGNLEKTIAFYQGLSEITYFSATNLRRAQIEYCKEDEIRYQQVIKRFIKDQGFE